MGGHCTEQYRVAYQEVAYHKVCWKIQGSRLARRKLPLLFAGHELIKPALEHYSNLEQPYLGGYFNYSPLLIWKKYVFFCDLCLVFFSLRASHLVRGLVSSLKKAGMGFVNPFEDLENFSHVAMMLLSSNVVTFIHTHHTSTHHTNTLHIHTKKCDRKSSPKPPLERRNGSGV